MPSIIMLRRILWYANGTFNLACTICTYVCMYLRRYRVLGQKIENWSIDANHMKRLPWLVWAFFAILPGRGLYVCVWGGLIAR